VTIYKLITGNDTDPVKSLRQNLNFSFETVNLTRHYVSDPGKKSTWVKTINTPQVKNT